MRSQPRAKQARRRLGADRGPSVNINAGLPFKVAGSPGPIGLQNSDLSLLLEILGERRVSEKSKGAQR